MVSFVSLVLILSLEIVFLLWLALCQYGILIWMLEWCFHWDFWIWSCLSQQSFHLPKHISWLHSVLSTRISFTTFACFFSSEELPTSLTRVSYLIISMLVSLWRDMSELNNKIWSLKKAYGSTLFFEISPKLSVFSKIGFKNLF